MSSWRSRRRGGTSPGRGRALVGLGAAAWLGGLGLLGGLLACSEGPPRRDAPPERIVLVVADTLRRDHVSPYAAAGTAPGTRRAPVSTPAIRALAERGQVFGAAYSSYHQTTMSMAALFTGRTPSIERGRDRERLDWTGETWCGLARLERPDDADRCIPGSVDTLAEALRDAGYWTLGVTSNELLFRPGGYERGFDRWIEVPGTPVPAGRVNEAVQRALAERPGDRLFLYVHYMDAHDYAARGWSYADGVRIVDRGVGRLMAILEETGLLEGAVVIFTADHGEHLPGEKHFLPANRGHSGSPSFDSLLEVPLIVAPPVFEGTGAPLRSDDLHRLIRVLAGATPGPAPELRPGEIYLSERHFQTYRHDGWKSFRHRPTGKHFVVDLTNDPGEQRNVADAHPDLVAGHAARMDALARALGAPDAGAGTLSPEDRARLRALGYEAAE